MPSVWSKLLLNTPMKEPFRANIAATGLSPRKTLIGFFLAWSLFFFILYGMPAPPGLSPQGQATLAVMVWASARTRSVPYRANEPTDSLASLSTPVT